MANTTMTVSKLFIWIAVILAAIWTVMILLGADAKIEAVTLALVLVSWLLYQATQ